jgi:hypothetical protein
MPEYHSQDRALTEAQVAIAALEVKFANVDDNLAELKADFKAAVTALNAKLDAVNTTLTEARGGWRTLMAVGGAAASAGAFASWIGQHVKW